MRIAVVGASGVVGQSMLNILSKCDVNIIALGNRSVGQLIQCGDSTYEVLSAKDYDYTNLDGVVISAGAQCAHFVRSQVKSAWIIDNSSAFRQEENINLVVPEIHEGKISRVVASPNCIAIPMAIVLHNLQQVGVIHRVWGSTYQSVSGAGRADLDLLNRKMGVYDTLSAEIGDIGTDGISAEEAKITYEVNKILGINIPINIMAVRVPIQYGHSMHLGIEMSNTKHVLEKISNSPYIKLCKNSVPDPKSVVGCHKVHIGRVRVTESFISMWVVSDNIYRGAAWNVCQVAKKFFGVKER